MDKLTTVNVGYAVGYYVNGEYYDEIHENDFTSEIEDIYRGLMVKFDVTKFEDIELDYDQYERFEDNDDEFPKKLADLLGAKEDDAE